MQIFHYIYFWASLRQMGQFMGLDASETAHSIELLNLLDHHNYTHFWTNV